MRIIINYKFKIMFSCCIDKCGQKYLNHLRGETAVNAVALFAMSDMLAQAMA